MKWCQLAVATWLLCLMSIDLTPLGRQLTCVAYAKRTSPDIGNFLGWIGLLLVFYFAGAFDQWLP